MESVNYGLAFKTTFNCVILVNPTERIIFLFMDSVNWGLALKTILNGLILVNPTETTLLIYGLCEVRIGFQNYTQRFNFDKSDGNNHFFYGLCELRIGFQNYTQRYNFGKTVNSFAADPANLISNFTREVAYGEA